MIETLLAAFIASHSPSTVKSTCYGFKANDVYPSTARRIGYDDPTSGGRVIWSQNFPRREIGIAHRHWPIGSWVIVTNPYTRKSFAVRVIDRGPYHWRYPKGSAEYAMHKNGGRTKTKWKKEPGWYTSDVDFAYGACFMLWHSGRQRILIRRIPDKSKLARALYRKHGRCPPPNTGGARWWQRNRKQCLKQGRW